MNPATVSRRIMLGGILSFCGAMAARSRVWAATRYIVIGTGGTGGVFYPYGGGLAQLLSKKLPDVQATAEVTGGSVDNIKLLASGNAELGFSTVDSAFDAMKGEGVYGDVGPQPIATLAVLYPSVLHVVASKASGIASVADMKGKRVSVGSAGSSTESIADRVMVAAGLDPATDVTRDNLGVGESVNALVDGKVDAFFWIGGVPTPAIKDLVTLHSGDVVFVSTGDLAAKLNETYPGVYARTTLKAGAYAGIEADMPVLRVDNVLLVQQGMDPGFAKEILAAIFDNLAEVQAFHPAAKRLTLETASARSAVPHHPAAVEFYVGRGMKMD